jgi:2-hydroxychromene-2-carboxylate isomerase
MADMLELLKDPKLKFVLKEFPVLGEGSTQAAQVAAAVRHAGTNPERSISSFTKNCSAERGHVDKVRALAVAKEVGLDVARLERDMASDEVKAQIEGV